MTSLTFRDIYHVRVLMSFLEAKSEVWIVYLHNSLYRYETYALCVFLYTLIIKYLACHLKVPAVVMI